MKCAQTRPDHAPQNRGAVNNTGWLHVASSTAKSDENSPRQATGLRSALANLTLSRPFGRTLRRWRQEILNHPPDGPLQRIHRRA